jgi:phosphate transport system permease protein
VSDSFLQFRRRFTDYLATFVAAGLSAIVVGTLVAIFAYLLIKGAGSVNWAFLTHTPKPVGEVGGGMANAIVGSIMVLGMGSLMGIPFGIGAGVYLAEYGHNRLGSLVRFTADVLNGVPSIVI